MDVNELPTLGEQAPPAIAPEATTPEIPAVVDEPQRIPGPEEATGLDVGQEPTVDDDLDDLDFGFEKYRVPKKLKAAVEDWRSATTKKEQEVADRKRTLDTEIEQRLQATEDELRDRALMITAQAEIDMYKKTDWVTLWRTDPVAAGEHQARFQQLQQAVSDTAEALNKKQTERTQTAQQELAKRVEQTISFAREKIPGWKPELTETLVKFAQSEGIPDEVIKANWSPTFYGLLHKAHIGSLALSKMTAPKPQPAQVAPLATVTGKSTPNAVTDLASADMDAYVAARKRGVGGRSSV